ncbi:LytR C-terminal domain-containing protein [Nocardioides marmorisolisilvae]|uniref:LytR family transcriptional regulator n=1 Tax=Nocardioides marmorisolisilvae TaxID=1542737 RepID=A0A3N0E0G7_9ACTN|nr:LytR C-terminal domain-containing protein [Nocardioides marmorisolisilvae]RNL81341.1 LytR family transcriptional regulator [Nocardioides marmorisolisilvae]
MNPRLTAPLSLAAAALAVLVMAMWGMNALTAPFEGDDSSGTDTSSCGSTHRTIKRSDVTVSVYNAGKRQGRAGVTLDRLESAGFNPGAVGNAPKGTKLHGAVVHTTKKDHPDATLVAEALGPHVSVVVTSVDLGPGVDVLIGDRFNKLDPKAPRSIRVTHTVGGC